MARNRHFLALNHAQSAESRAYDHAAVSSGALGHYIATMAMADNAYSRLVFWLKVLLPVAALGILSTLFLVAETLDPEKAIPYADVDVEKILREQGITRPRFGGVTDGGASVTIGAASVRPDAGNTARLIGRELSGQILIPDGARIDVMSPTGIVDGATREVTLQGGAALTSSLGYRLETEELISRFDIVRSEATGEVRGTGPIGALTAGGMLLEQDAETQGYVLVFKDGVRLVYDP